MHLTNQHKFPYEWRLSDGYPAKGIEKNGLKVFSCFSCGGGSTMGYKLAGYDVIGCNEIDPRMMEVYKANHNPKYSFLEGIQTFKDREDLPEELYNLDILDGSPPCSSFSMAGNREKDWGSDKKFREGQAEQVLDTLFFDFIELAEKLQPKVVIAENVKGMLLGNAFEYIKKVYHKFNKAGYYVQHFLLDGSVMGLPQKRERVFFVCIRRDIAQPFVQQVDMFSYMPFIDLSFNEKAIPFKEVTCNTAQQELNTTGTALKYWHLCKKGDSFSTVSGGSFFNWVRLDENKPAPTLHTENGKMYHPDICRPLNNREYALCSSFPLDYDYGKEKTGYLCGMSVPPVMTAQIASRIYEQWLSKLPQQTLAEAS
jgi:DNA (cytosine-5)-methyltransferase 1